AIGGGLHVGIVALLDRDPGPEPRAGPGELLPSLGEQVGYDVAILAERAPRDDLGSRRERVEQHEATRAFALTERRQTRHPHQERVAPVRALGAEEPHELLLEAIGEGRQGAVLD